MSREYTNRRERRARGYVGPLSLKRKGAVMYPTTKADRRAGLKGAPRIVYVYR